MQQLENWALGKEVVSIDTFVTTGSWSVCITSRINTKRNCHIEQVYRWLTISLRHCLVTVTQECALWSMTFAFQPHFTGSGLHHVISYYTLFSHFSFHQISKQLFSLSTLQAPTCDCAFKFNSFWLDSTKDGAITGLFSCPALVWLVSA